MKVCIKCLIGWAAIGIVLAAAYHYLIAKKRNGNGNGNGVQTVSDPSQCPEGTTAISGIAGWTCAPNTTTT